MVKTNEGILDELSEIVWSEDKPFNSERALELVTKRNELLCRGFHPSTSMRNYENSCELLKTSTQIPTEFRAYHSGPAQQSKLIDSGKSFEGHRTCDHIYFSFDLGYVIANYLLPSHYENNWIYITDLRNVKNARVQTSYKSEVLFNDKIRTLIECYEDQKFMEKLLKEKWGNVIYIEPLKHRPREEIRKAIIHEIDTWLSRYTIPFRLKHLERYKKKRQDFILVPPPIGIKY